MTVSCAKRRFKQLWWMAVPEMMCYWNITKKKTKRKRSKEITGNHNGFFSAVTHQKKIDRSSSEVRFLVSKSVERKKKTSLISIWISIWWYFLFAEKICTHCKQSWKHSLRPFPATSSGSCNESNQTKKNSAKKKEPESLLCGFCSICSSSCCWNYPIKRLLHFWYNGNNWFRKSNKRFEAVTQQKKTLVG